MEQLIFHYKTALEMAQATAQDFLQDVQAKLSRNEFLAVALSGGRTPAAFYDALVAHPQALVLKNPAVHFFWSDERFVAVTDPQSNFGLAQKRLLSPLDISSAQIHRFSVELPGATAAAAYEAALRQFFPRDSWPVFDFLFLGLGEDGHTASLFPGTTALNEGQKWVVENIQPQTRQARLTFSFPAILSARKIIVMAAGASKIKVFKRLQQGADLPAARLQKAAGLVEWRLAESE